VAHPNPSKAAQFRSVDLASTTGAVQVALQAEVKHFVYVSVAHPAPMMKAYIEVRTECEDKIRESGMNATILRPWYVLGPGHRWPYALLPMYWLMELLPATREGAWVWSRGNRWSRHWSRPWRIRRRASVSSRSPKSALLAPFNRLLA
jgi:uncharacterized protein YbjT (DUF2867 family)